MHASTRRSIGKVVHAVSMVLVLKGIIGGSLAMLALLGVAVPIFGINSTPEVEGGVAVFGAILGAIAAMRA